MVDDSIRVAPGLAFLIIDPGPSRYTAWLAASVGSMVIT